MTARPPDASAAGDRMLDSALRKSQSLLGAAQAFAVGLDELGDIDAQRNRPGADARDCQPVSRKRT